MRTKILLLLLCCLGLNASAQDSLMIGLNFDAGQLRLASLNVYSGQVSILSAQPTSPDQFSSGVAAYDPVGNRFFYPRAGNIYTVNTQNGAVISSPAVTCPNCAPSNYSHVTNIEFDRLSGELVGLRHRDDGLSFIKINPSTGVMTEMTGQVASQAIYQSGVSALDPYSKTYYYIQGSDRLVSIATDSGQVISSVTLPNPNGSLSPLTNIAYNPLDGHIYGLNYIGTTANSAAELRLAKFNPVSGIYSLITAQPVSADQFQSGVADVDPAGNKFTYTRFLGNGSFESVSLDLTTGQVVARPVLNFPGSPVLPVTNICYAKPAALTRTPDLNFSINQNGQQIEIRSLSRFVSDWSWDFGDGATHTAEHPQHTYTSPGTYTLRLVAHNRFGTDTLSQTVFVGTTGIASEDLKEINLFPNPSRGRMQITLGAELNHPGTVEIRDIRGTVVQSTQVQPGNASISLELPESAPSGIYFLRLLTKERTLSRKFLLQR